MSVLPPLLVGSSCGERERKSVAIACCAREAGIRREDRRETGQDEDDPSTRLLLFFLFSFFTFLIFQRAFSEVLYFSQNKGAPGVLTGIRYNNHNKHVCQ